MLKKCTRAVLERGGHNLSLSDDDACGRVLVSGEEGEQVVGTTMAGLGDQGKVGRQTTVVGIAGLVLVLVRALDVVRKLPRAIKHGPGVVRAILVFLVSRECLSFLLGEADTNEITICDPLQSMAGSTDLSVNLMTTANAAEKQKPA